MVPEEVEAGNMYPVDGSGKGEAGNMYLVDGSEEVVTS